jgi:hypothetical protein
LRSWSAATDLVRSWEASGEIGVVKKPDVPSISEAVEKFFIDLKAQKLSRETIRKYENLLNKRLLPWCEAKGYRYLKQLGVEDIRQFRAGWPDSALYATKNMERILAACGDYRGDRDRLRAFVLVMRHSGLQPDQLAADEIRRLVIGAVQ